MRGNDIGAVGAFVRENRDEIMRLIRSDDTFLRAMGFAVLLTGGDEADVELVKRELELLQELDGEYDL